MAFRENEGSNLHNLLEGFCKRGDVVGFQKFIAKERNQAKKIAEYRKNMLYKSIEFRQPKMIKYILTDLT